MPGRDNGVGFVCDDGPQVPNILASYQELKRRNPSVAKYMRGLAIRDDKRHPPLQAADLMADIAREMVAAYIADPHQQESPTLKQNVVSVKVWTKPYMLEVLGRSVGRRVECGQSERLGTK
jgi:hypothetical protein